MRTKPFYLLLLCGALLASSACTERLPKESRAVSEQAVIFPDYTAVTVPPNVAPLNFQLESPHVEAFVRLTVGDEELVVKERGGSFHLPADAWKRLLEVAKGKTIEVQLYAKEKEWVAYPAFPIHVAKEPMDPYIAYRLIAPGYELWNQMGIYQRDVKGFGQKPIMENQYTDRNCMNCHSFCARNPRKMLFHMRDKHAGTYLIDGDRVEKLNTKTDRTISPLVYPSWHPAGRYVAFSVNETSQAFHANDKNRVEVFDRRSDVVVYDTERHEIVGPPLLRMEGAFETFPTFSADGGTLYFCTAEARQMPEAFKEVRYSLCSIAFDPERGTFGSRIDTLYNAREGYSVSFPRVSPDGRFLLYTRSGYGNFSIWHKDADLWMIDLESRESFPLEAANSDDVESYHAWSGNSRWIVFSSRRMDGLYTRLYFAYIDERGRAAKPFLLPQEDPGFYRRFMKSYNIPEFIEGEVPSHIRTLKRVAREDGSGVGFRE